MAMKRGMTISALGHGAVLVWALVTFAWPYDVKPMSAESMPVDLITADQFTKLTAGTRQAPKQETAKPVAEKIGEEKPVQDPSAKVVENKKEVVATAEQSSPLPAPKPPEPKPAAAPTQKNEAKAEDKKPPEQKIDPIAEALKKDEAKKPEPKPLPKPQPVKKEVRQQPKFDPRKVAALLDKRDSQRQAASAAALNRTAALGAATTGVQHLSQTALDALRARLMSLWNPPAGARNVEELIVHVHIKLTPNGKLAEPPRLLDSPTSNPLFQAARDSALRAIYRGQPFDMLPVAQYDIWKELDITFDPRDLGYGG